MERWTFIRRLFARFRHSAANRRHNVSIDSSGFFTSPTNYLWANRFQVDDFRPKALPNVNYNEILTGTRIEDFSADCWLDGHIHRFASPEEICPDPDYNLFSSDEDVSSATASSDSEDNSNSSSPRVSPSSTSPRNILLDLFVPLYEPSPPPYFDDPPPTYEEAITDGHLVEESNFMIQSGDEDHEEMMWY